MTAKKSPVFVRDATGLVRQISTLDAFAITLSGMGLLFVYNAIVFTPAFYPDANPLALPLFGFFIALPIAIMYALMSIAIARTGGDYVWVSRIIHPSLGFVVNFAITIVMLSFTGISSHTAVQWYIAEAFYDLGVIYHNPAFLGLATYLQQADPAFWFSVLIVIITGLFVILSTRLSALIIRYWTYLAFAIAAVFIATVLWAGNSAFVSNFNAMSGTTYAAVVSAGQQAGSSPGVPSLLSYDSLYAGAAVGSLNYSAFFFPAYFAGEVKQVKRTQFVAQVGSLVVFGVISGIMIYVMYMGEGPAFANAIATLWAKGSSKFPYVSIPSASGMSMYWTQNPFLVTMFNLSLFATIIVMNIAIFFTLSRNIFAWSFDRIAPTGFARLNNRTNTPVYAVAVEIVAGIIFAYISVYRFGILASYFSYGVAGIFIAFIFVALAGAMFPYVRRDVFDQSDPIVKRKFVGVPMIVFLSVLSIIISAIVVYAVILPSIGSVSFFIVFLDGIVPTFIIGAVIYAVAAVYRHRQGIDLRMIHAQIPPE